MEIALAILISLITTVPLVLFRAFVLRTAFIWFIVPWLHLPVPSYSIVVGVLMMLGLVLNSLRPDDEAKENDRSPLEVAILATLKSALVSLIGWGLMAIVHCFV